MVVTGGEGLLATGPCPETSLETGPEGKRRAGGLGAGVGAGGIGAEKERQLPE